MGRCDPPYRVRFPLACLGAALLVRCAVDDRPLRAQPVSALGHGQGAASGSDGEPGGGAPNGGADGRIRWSFDEDEEGFQPEDDISQEWSTEDGREDTHSGSLLLAALKTSESREFWTAGASVCTPIEAKTEYVLTVETYIESGQGEGAGGLSVEIYNAPDCQGLLLDLHNYLNGSTGVWVIAKSRLPTPAKAVSARVRPVVSKALREPAFRVRFDNILLDPSPDG